jgi:hypothetical protein
MVVVADEFGGGHVTAAEVHMGYSGVRAWLPYLLMLPLASVVLMWMGLGQIQVIYPNAKRRALASVTPRGSLRCCGPTPTGYHTTTPSHTPRR